MAASATDIILSFILQQGRVSIVHAPIDIFQFLRNNTQKN